MGECGCVSNVYDIAKLETEDGMFIMSIYPGCVDCAQLSGVDIRKISKEDGDFEYYVHNKSIKDLREISEYGFSIPVVEWEEIGRSIAKEVGSLKDYEDFDELWYDHGDKVKEATSETFRKFWEKGVNR